MMNEQMPDRKYADGFRGSHEGAARCRYVQSNLSQSVPPILTLAKALHTIPLKRRLWATAMATPQLVKYVVFLSLSEIDTKLVHRDPSVRYTTSGSHISRLLT